ncbi:head GIN domain-containing protein [Bizionia sp. KMM 8389]
MKKIVFLLVVIIISSCSTENANDCFQTTGHIVQESVPVESFDRIVVFKDVTLILKEAAEYSVVVETGANLMNDVEVVVADNQLQISDYNTCNLVRDYGVTKVYVSAPNITEIRSSTQFEIQSDGVLNYPNLALISENFNMPEALTVGDFKLNVNTHNLTVSSNNLSSYFMSGTVENLNVRFYSGIGRFEGRHLTAQKVHVYHRGGNDVVVNPIQELKGDLYGTGNLLSVNRPPLVEVEQHYQGGLIFE